MSNVLRVLRRASILFTLLLLPIASFAGFSVSNGQLVDNNGTPFIMRGVNYPYTWFQSRNTQADLAAIAATGSNTVRIVLATGGQWARNNGTQVAQLIQWCKDLKMIAVLEVHDSTGWSEQTTAVPISNATAYWTSSDIRAAINGQENFVIINIANEPFGNTTTANYLPDTIAAIQALRAAGLTHTIMIDGATWGQDWQNTMRTNAMQLWNADTRRNLLFSVHMYEVYQSLAPIQTYMQGFDDMGLPLVIGEFGPINNGQFVDSDSVIAQAQLRGNGYIGWSWSGNGGGGTGLDMTVNFDPAQLTTWGNRIVNGTSGIRTTSVLASVFGTPTNNLTVSPTTLSFGSAASSSAIAVTANVSWTVTDDQTWLSASPTSGANNGSFTVSTTANTSTTSRTGTVTITGGGLTRTVAVTQAAPTANNLTLSQTSLSFASAAASSAVNVTANVSWTVTDDQTWLSASPTSGSNNGSFTVSATANTGSTSRAGTVTVTGGGLTRTVAVTQAGTTASNLTLSASTWSAAATASTSAMSVTSNVAWGVTDDQTWLSASPTSGTGNGSFTLSATANTATTIRTGTVTVSGGGITRTVAVTQAGSGGGTGGTCPNPVTFSGNTGNFNTTGAACYRTNANINGWGCYNFDGRTLTVGGVARTCGQMPLTRSADGYYYFSATAGQFPWAGIYAW
ncbi:MAG TPA: BACON domain-containing carbohydrate-binding protein [Steroidobacteraceae bacterium]|nr:BACON domain-containing carbohydrate-binding protein [Steroidobacteraceae bacterium]